MTRSPYTLGDFNRDAGQARDDWAKATAGFLGRADKRLRADEAYRRAVGDAAAQFADAYREESRAAHARTLTTCEQLREDAATADQARKRADHRVSALTERVIALEHIRDDLIDATGLGAVPTDKAIAYITSLRDEVAELRRKDAEHLCEPLPQRVSKTPGIDTAGTEARILTAKTRLTGPVWDKPAPEPATDPPATDAKPTSAPRSRPSVSQSAQKARGGTSGGSARSKPAESRTEPQADGAA